MSPNTPMRDLRTLGYVLRRTNYGEVDRILNLITPEGKFSVLAKGVRREKSKLAGGIELFTLSDFNLHFGHGELGIVTSARMWRFHSGIIKDLARIELATAILKRVSTAAENVSGDEYFRIVDESLTALGEGERLELVESWALVQLHQVMGEEINLYRDAAGNKLSANEHYHWDNYERIFVPALGGDYGANEIKYLRLMTTSSLPVVRRVKATDELISRVWQLVKSLG